MPAGGGSNSGVVQVATKTLTNAQVKALWLTPVQVLAAQGVGTIVLPLHATLRLDWHADYTGIAVNSQIYLQSGTNPISGHLDEAKDTGISALLAGGGPDGSIALLPFDALASVPAFDPSFGRVFANSGYFDSDISNKATTLAGTNAGADYTGGNAANTLKVTMLYYVVTF